MDTAAPPPISDASISLVWWGGLVLVLYGDVPLIRAQTLRAVVDAPRALSVLTCEPADPAGYGQVLYATLRELDRAGHGRLLVQRPPAGEAWLAIANRLERAAHPERLP